MRKGALHPAIESEGHLLSWSINDRLGALCEFFGTRKAGADIHAPDIEGIEKDLFEFVMKDLKVTTPEV
jgi:hypothetical protein